MTNAADLLRLLEPAVRPTGPGAGAVAPAGKTPLEGQDFQQLLTQFKQQQSPEAAPASTPPAPAAKPPDPLAALNGVENPSLRTLLAANQTPFDEDTNPAETR